jgi:AcrR family transcriptional regulator
MSEQGPARRRDAERNREAILAAAREAFAEGGVAVGVDEIARRAGVGHATVFRRFPTKDDLIAAVVLERIRELAAVAEEAAADPDAGAAFERFIWHAGELHATGGRLHECFDKCVAKPEHTELHARAARLVERAQAAGAVRADVTADEIETIFAAVLRSANGGDWRRYVAIVLDGLRPPKSDASAT